MEQQNDTPDFLTHALSALLLFATGVWVLAVVLRWYPIATQGPWTTAILAGVAFVGFGAIPSLAKRTYLVKNLATFLVVLLIISTVTFALARSIPGGPFSRERTMPETVKAMLSARYNLDAPLLEQYTSFLGNVAMLDLGPSFREEGRTVNQIIGYSFPNSVRLGSIALCISIGLGLPLGMISAMYRNRWPDYTALGVVVLGVSVPSFIVATLLQYIFSYKLRNFLPASGMSSWKSMIMPSLALATLPGAFIIRLVRSEMIDVMSQQYMTAARARGIGIISLVWKHALRNTLLTVVTYMGPIIAGLFTGSFVIEKIFNIPGMGSQFVQAINNRDYNLILGTTLFYSVMLVGLNMLIDALYHLIDPRVREGGAS